MSHQVTDVQGLYDAACVLYKNDVVGSLDSSADSILGKLSLGIDNLKNSWKGMDAGVQINNVVTVYNAMVAIRNSLSELAVESSKIASNYREIQINNGATSLDTLSILSFETKTTMSEYTDTADTINITEEAKAGYQNVKSAKDAIELFVKNVRTHYDTLMQIWVSGPGRDNAQSIFEGFFNTANQYVQILIDVEASILQALNNYSIN